MSFGRRWPGNSVRFRTDYLFRNGNDGYGGALWCWTLLQTPHLRIGNGGNAAASSIGGGFLPFRRRPRRKRRQFGLPYLTRTDGEPGHRLAPRSSHFSCTVSSSLEPFCGTFSLHTHSRCRRRARL